MVEIILILSQTPFPRICNLADSVSVVRVSGAVQKTEHLALGVVEVHAKCIVAVTPDARAVVTYCNNAHLIGSSRAGACSILVVPFCGEGVAE